MINKVIYKYNEVIYIINKSINRVRNKVKYNDYIRVLNKIY